MQVEGVITAINNAAGMFTAHLRDISHIQGSWILVRGFFLGYNDALGVFEAVIIRDTFILTGSDDDNCTCDRTGDKEAGYYRCY